MKNLFLLVLVLFLSDSFYTQCCPYIDSVVIIPEVPNDAEETKVILTVTTPNLGQFISATSGISDNQVIVEACYYSGLATALQTYVDTVNLGILQAGNYDLIFIAQQSSNMDECIVEDSQNASDSFTVDIAGSVGELEKLPIKIYPNPSDGEFVNVSTEMFVNRIEIIDLKGKLVMTLENINASGELQFSLSDLPKAKYFMNFYDDKGASFVQEIVLQ